MKKSVVAMLLASVCVSAIAAPAFAEAPKSGVADKKTDKFADAIAGLERKDGLAPIFVDKKKSRILMLLPKPSADGIAGRYIYQTYLRAGLGSNPTGLDRSAPGDTQILAFRKVGGKIVAQFENWGFSAARGSVDEQKAVADSFPISSVWSNTVEAESLDGGLLVDITSFLVRDAQGIAKTLKRSKQGDFRLNDGLSYADTGEVNVFPTNVELEAVETFVGDDPGGEVRGIVPDPRNVTLALHHSFVALPEPGYVPRQNDPRVGVIDHTVADYSAPLGEPIVYRLVHRFRLEKTDPAAARSPVKKPIVFYVDRAAPEPVRSALIEGGRWWSQAFEAAGFIDAFKVELLPEGVSPLDARYNVVNWVHRQTRGWSYGHAVVDPRTGEIIKGDVLLGSQRVRQDRMIFEGLEGADKTGQGGPNDPIEISLARLRQLAPHEIGHSIGLQHNFAASTYGGRASVMDYPAPKIAIKDGQLDFSDAYARGVGAWDRFVIDWLYGVAPAGVDEKAWLKAKADKSQADGLRYVSDEDARAADTPHPLGAVWDNGSDPVAELDHVMAVRKIALDRFGLRNLPKGASVADLRRIVVPIYIFQRYQVDATAKLVGGIDFTYGAEGHKHEASRIVSADRQSAAIDALLRTITPAALDLPDTALDVLTSGQSQGGDHAYEIETFQQGPVFDLPAAAEVAADLVWSDLFAPARLNRLMEAKRRDPAQPGVEGLLDKALAFAAFDGKATGRQAELARRVRQRLVVGLAQALADKDLSPTAGALIRARLVDWGKGLKTAVGDAADKAQARVLAGVVLDESGERLAALIAEGKAKVAVPPGPPIGEDDWFGDLRL
ncbi:zinc-dependent metalloprotease [uncultured Caulobacter sp.]|uniref:zinc-dependent metalloprotease n=1 Tax=uncultured Caulobacter sp. TaxID=158749 RepID=UPI002610C8C9|nr:zinc-dependent metalloprotease [uncultured Caulobacter sp.]